MRHRGAFQLLFDLLSPFSIVTRSHSPISVLESGLVAIAEESGTIPSHALNSLGPVKIDHLQEINVVETEKPTVTPVPLLSGQARISSHHQETSEPTDEGNGARKTSCGPETKLGVFKSLLAPSSRCVQKKKKKKKKNYYFKHINVIIMSITDYF